MAENGMKIATCSVVDAQHKEKIGENSYCDGVLIKLKDIETEQYYNTFLSEQELREILGLSRPLTSREIMHFASELNNRTDPIVTHVPAGGGKKITPKMVEANEELDKEDNDINLKHPVSEKKINKNKLKQIQYRRKGKNKNE